MSWLLSGWWVVGTGFYYLGVVSFLICRPFYTTVVGFSLGLLDCLQRVIQEGLLIMQFPECTSYELLSAFDRMTMGKRIHAGSHLRCRPLQFDNIVSTLFSAHERSQSPRLVHNSMGIASGLPLFSYRRKVLGLPKVSDSCSMLDRAGVSKPFYGSPPSLS